MTFVASARIAETPQLGKGQIPLGPVELTFDFICSKCYEEVAN